MKRKVRLLPILLILAALIIGGVVLGIFLYANQQEDEPSEPAAAEKTDWIAILREELYSEDTPLTQAMADAVTLKLVDESETSITVEVTAPDVSDAALEWFEAVSEDDYSDQALEDTLLELLKGKTTTATFVLPLDAQGKPYTTGEFLDAASGGVRKFYAALTVMFMEEMEANAND
jgi:flagellar basal body-associated protein FliL